MKEYSLFAVLSVLGLGSFLVDIIFFRARQLRILGPKLSTAVLLMVPIAWIGIALGHDEIGIAAGMCLFLYVVVTLSRKKQPRHEDGSQATPPDS
jgi:hypothetical protein